MIKFATHQEVARKAEGRPGYKEALYKAVVHECKFGVLYDTGLPEYTAFYQLFAPSRLHLVASGGTTKYLWQDWIGEGGKWVAGLQLFWKDPKFSVSVPDFDPIDGELQYTPVFSLEAT